MNHRILVLIPARYESSRFPGKPLAMVSKKSLIQRVVENCLNTGIAGLEVAVVTNNSKIEEHLKEKSLPVVRVDDEVISGTERIALAKNRHFNHQEWDLTINLQGDEPLFTAEILKNFVRFSLEHDFDMTTIIRPGNSDKDFENRNIVKCAYETETSKCLYFSREPIPHFADGLEKKWYQHIGIYGFKNDSLNRFLNLSPSQIELSERLEQLRALANGMTMGALVSEATLIGVDWPEDVNEVEKYLKNNQLD